jgi:hypothetical protein
MSFIGSKLLYEKNQVFGASSSSKGVIKKIESEPYSYSVETCKIHVFKNDELRDFMKWYFENDRHEFLFDFLSKDGGNACHKYFKMNGVDYNIELFDHFDEWVKDIDHFLDFCIGQYKKFDIYKRKDWFFHFATKKGIQIFIEDC